MMSFLITTGKLISERSNISELALTENQTRMDASHQPQIVVQCN